MLPRPALELNCHRLYRSAGIPEGLIRWFVGIDLAAPHIRPPSKDAEPYAVTLRRGVVEL